MYYICLVPKIPNIIHDIIFLCIQIRAKTSAGTGPFSEKKIVAGKVTHFFPHMYSQYSNNPIIFPS